MPPSPALRRSPGRELRVENHKRGHSLESGLFLRDKEDDLALFNEMQTREKDDFLLKSSDDFEDSFSTKLRYFSELKLGVSIPVRGESSDLLNVDGEKNDYDWLLTPPDTPLFPSLDDETPQVHVGRRARPRSQPITISRSSTMEKNYATSRGSASPHRLSPSPRSGNGTFQPRGRSPSAPQSNPPQVVRQNTPSRRPSTPPGKLSTPGPRSSSPTPRRMSTGSSGSSGSSGIRGTSPAKPSRGTPSSPKIKAWQSNIPGFSSDAPPNLRTSLADRPTSYVRGSSPASRNGRDSSSKPSRQSMSPTASRSVSSSHSHDRDGFSSFSKGSVASSGDDDMDSLQSTTVGSLDRAMPRKVGGFPNSSRAMAFSKKPGRTLSSSPVPKRSFESAHRQLDNRKGPQNMFRPLLSSVPSTTFYVGKASSAHRPMLSRNSSVTTSSNASSDHGTSVVLDTEGSDHNQDDIASECGKSTYPDAQDEVFAFDKTDVVNEDVRHEIQDESPNICEGDFDKAPAIVNYPVDSESLGHHDNDIAITSTSEGLYVNDGGCEADLLEDKLLCSNCGCSYRATEPVEEGIELCPDCAMKDGGSAVIVPVLTSTVSENSPVPAMLNSEGCKPYDELDSRVDVPELPEVTDKIERKGAENEGQTSYSEQSQKQNIVIGQSNLKVDVSEGAGISLLLVKRPTSSKGPVIQGRTFTASTVPYDDPSYARDSASSLRSSIGYGSVSASSSVDLTSARQTDTRIQRQLSGRRSDIENYRHDMNAKHQRSGSSLSGISNPAQQASSLSTSINEERFDVSDGKLGFDPLERGLTSEKIVARDVKDSSRTKDLGEDNLERSESWRSTDTSSSDASSRSIGIHLEDNSVTGFPKNEECISYGNGEEYPSTARAASDIETSAMILDPSLEQEDPISNASLNGVVDIDEVPGHSSLARISEVEIENGCPSTPSLQIEDAVSVHSMSLDEVQVPSVPLPTPSYEDDSASIPEPSTSNLAHGILEESAVTVQSEGGSQTRVREEESVVTVQSQGGSQTRSLTLEEATDAILFCSSIVHNLAYQAATIAIEKENPVPLESSRPIIIPVEKPSSDRKDPRTVRIPAKRITKQKTKQKRFETDTKPPSTTMTTTIDDKTDEIITRGNDTAGLPSKVDSLKPPKLESKCNCTVM